MMRERQSRIKRRLLILLAVLLALYGLLLLAVRFLGGRMVFFPNAYTSSDWTLPDGGREVRFPPSVK